MVGPAVDIRLPKRFSVVDTLCLQFGFTGIVNYGTVRERTEVLGVSDDSEVPPANEREAAGGALYLLDRALLE